MRLTEIERETWVRFVGIEGNDGVEQKLAQFGLFTGDRARVMRCAPLGGPLLLEAGGREIALGRQLAERILVEPS
jgi:Fe2+ transport system protein FeoA